MTARGESLAPAGRSAELRPAGGVRLHYRAWIPDGPRAALLVAHGLGEHSGRYASLAAKLTRRGIAVFAPDFRGHGLSGGIRGHAGRFEDFLAELEAVRREAVASLPGGVASLLLGHSLGGLIAIRYLQRHPEAPFRGAVFSAPALGLTRVSAVERALARVLSRLLPWLPVPNGIDAADLSHDPAEVAAYRDDPRVHRWITPRLFTEMERSMRAAFDERDRVRLPALFLVPGEDRIASADATLAFCRGTDFEVRRYPDSFHEPLHEVRREEVMEEVAGWMEARIA